MNDSERETILYLWTKPSSDSEKDQQERAVRMVNAAIDAWPALAGTRRLVFAKGSYPNNTNVRADSDVDVVVECHECTYYDFDPGVTANPGPVSPYEGEWSPSLWRAEVGNALKSHFGASGVDLTGRVALNVKAVAGSRPSADVVPSFDYYRYLDAGRQRSHRGSCVFDTSLTKIVNWPEQQLENGRAKNTRTNGRYKKFVRALKRCENVLAAAGEIEELPSYFMECLVWNVENATINSGNTLQEGFGAALFALWDGIEKGDAENWIEPNGLKWLFRNQSKWKSSDAKGLVQATWSYFTYGS